VRFFYILKDLNPASASRREDEPPWTAAEASETAWSEQPGWLLEEDKSSRQHILFTFLERRNINAPILAFNRRPSRVPSRVTKVQKTTFPRKK